MKRTIPELFTFMLCIGLFFSCSKATDKTAVNGKSEENAQLAEGNSSTLSRDELLSKGEHLVTVGVCDDCHSPKKYKNGMPEPDMSRRLSGHPASLKLPSYDASTIKNGWVLGNEH